MKAQFNLLFSIAAALTAYSIQALEVTHWANFYTCGDHRVIVEKFATDENGTFRCDLRDEYDNELTNPHCNHESNRQPEFYDRGIVFDGTGQLIAFNETACVMTDKVEQ